MAADGGSAFELSTLSIPMSWVKAHSVSWRNLVEGFAFAPQRHSVNVT